MFLIQKYTQYKAAQAEQQKRKVTEKELAHLNHKIDKLLSKLDEHEPEVADNQDEECVVCVNAKATMQTYPCGHRVVCRKCFVKTIQMAVAQRLLPLRCVLCRAKILRLKHANGIPLASSASQYTIGSQWYHVPQSSSLYSVTSSTSGISGVSGVSSASSCSSASSYKTCASGFSSASLKKRSYCKQGYQPLRTSSPSPSRSPQNQTSNPSAANHQIPSAANHQIPSVPKKENHGHRVAPVEGPAPISIASGGTTITAPGTHPPKGKLSLIQEFQREFRNGKLKSAGDGKGSSGSHRSGGSTRIKCARLLVNQAQESTSMGVKVDGNKRVKGDVLARSTSSASGVGGTSSSAFSGKSSAACGSSAGFRRATPPPPPPSSQSCHSFRLSRHDTVTPAPSALKSGKLLAFECSPVSDAKEIRSSTHGNEIKTKLAKSGVCGTSSEEKPLLPATIPPPQSAKRIVSPKM